MILFRAARVRGRVGAAPESCRTGTGLRVTLARRSLLWEQEELEVVHKNNFQALSESSSPAKAMLFLDEA